MTTLFLCLAFLILGSLALPLALKHVPAATEHAAAAASQISAPGRMTYTSPALALLRNDAMLFLHGDYEDAQTGRKVGFWRGRYSAWSAWAQWDLRTASTIDFADFADEANAVVSELFTEDHTPAGSMTGVF